MSENGTPNDHSILYKGRSIFRPGKSGATGFDHNYTATKVVDAFPRDKGIEYLVQWKEVEFLEWIPREITNEKIPHLVIEFLQSRLIFKSAV